MKSKIFYGLLLLGIAIGVGITLTVLKNIHSNEALAVTRAQAFVDGEGMIIGSSVDVPGYQWTAHPANEPGIYLVDLRTRTGDGWTWRVDEEFNQVTLANGPTASPSKSSYALPILVTKIPFMIVAQGDSSAGRTLFNENCLACHGAGGKNQGGPGPSIAGVGLASGQVAYFVRNPAAIDPDSGMPRLDLTDQQIEDICTYVAGLR